GRNTMQVILTTRRNSVESDAPRHTESGKILHQTHDCCLTARVGISHFRNAQEGGVCGRRDHLALTMRICLPLIAFVKKLQEGKYAIVERCAVESICRIELFHRR